MGRHRDNAIAHDARLHPVAVPQQIRREDPHHLFRRVRCRGHQIRGASTQIQVGIPVGYEPALFNPNEKLSNAISVTGQILGTQVESQRIDETLNFDLIDPDWINNTYMPIRLLIRDVGVFFAWNLQTSPRTRLQRGRRRPEGELLAGGLHAPATEAGRSEMSYDSLKAAAGARAHRCPSRSPANAAHGPTGSRHARLPAAPASTAGRPAAAGQTNPEDFTVSFCTPASVIPSGMIPFLSVRSRFRQPDRRTGWANAPASPSPCWTPPHDDIGLDPTLRHGAMIRCSAVRSGRASGLAGPFGQGRKAGLVSRLRAHPFDLANCKRMGTSSRR